MFASLHDLGLEKWMAINENKTLPTVFIQSSYQQNLNPGSWKLLVHKSKVC